MDKKANKPSRAQLREKLKNLGDPELDPYEIEFLPQFKANRGSKEAYINEHDVIIGDHEYESPHSPLQTWSLDTDPAVMAGDQWVHNYKDIGFHSKENREYFESGIPPEAGTFAHPDKDVAYELGLDAKGNQADQDEDNEK